MDELRILRLRSYAVAREANIAHEEWAVTAKREKEARAGLVYYTGAENAKIYAEFSAIELRAREVVASLTAEWWKLVYEWVDKSRIERQLGV